MEHKQNINSNKINEQISENAEALKKEIERIFINLNYLGNIDDKVYWLRCVNLDIAPSDKITWWNHYTIDQYSSSSNYYDFVLPNDVDYDKHDIILSFGRELKFLYYYEKDYVSAFGDEGYRARPIFEKDFVQNSVYVYLIDKIDLCDSELASEDMGKFMKGKIPFELPEIEDEINEPKKIPYALTGRSIYDPTAFYDEWGFKVNSPITLWDIAKTEINAFELASKYKFTLPENFDYNSNDLVISYGRQISRIEYQEVLENEEEYVFIATFEDNHFGNEIFFYRIEKQTKTFLPWHVASPCYILEKGESVYIELDLFSLNERDIGELTE